MCAIMNGLALHGGFIPYGGTFLVFSDYARNALRMAALMKLRVIYVFTHDSIGLGEDGPTHQPVEHAASLRLMPNMDVWRPCDTVETAVAWIAAIERRDGPTSLLFSRQNLPFQKRDAASSWRTWRAAATCSTEARGTPRAVIIATGSEVALALDAQELLAGEGHRRCAWCRCPRPACSTARTRPTAQRCCRAACRASRWKRASPISGASTWAWRAARGRHRPLRRIGAGRRTIQDFGFTAGQGRRGGEAGYCKHC